MKGSGNGVWTVDKARVCGGWPICCCVVGNDRLLRSKSFDRRLGLHWQDESDVIHDQIDGEVTYIHTYIHTNNQSMAYKAWHTYTHVQSMADKASHTVHGIVRRRSVHGARVCDGNPPEFGKRLFESDKNNRSVDQASAMFTCSRALLSCRTHDSMTSHLWALRRTEDLPVHVKVSHRRDTGLPAHTQQPARSSSSSSSSSSKQASSSNCASPLQR